VCFRQAEVEKIAAAGVEFWAVVGTQVIHRDDTCLSHASDRPQALLIRIVAAGGSA